MLTTPQAVLPARIQSPDTSRMLLSAVQLILWTAFVAVSCFMATKLASALAEGCMHFLSGAELWVSRFVAAG